MAPVSPDLIALLGATPEGMASARAAALRGLPAMRPATEEEAESPGVIGPNSALARQRALAEALRNRKPDTGAYELFGGDSESAVRERADSVNAALRRQRAAGSLGLLTGDRVLSGFGQSQLQGADKQEAMLAEAGQFRAGQTLKSALAAEEAKRAAARQRHDDEQRELDRKSRERAAAIQSGDKALQQKLDNETGLRKEFWSLPAVKEFADTETNYQTIKDVVGDTTGMGATTLVFSIMKMLDPGVSVMQGDVDLIRQSGGKAAQWANVYESVLKGNPLSDKVRSDILRQAETIYQNRLGTVEKLASKYGILASEIGVNPERVLLGMGSTVGGPKRTTPTESLPTGPEGNPTLDTGANTNIPPLRLKKGQRAADVIPEGEKRVVNMGEGKTRIIQKVGGKIVVVGE